MQKEAVAASFLTSVRNPIIELVNEIFSHPILLHRYLKFVNNSLTNYIALIINV